MKFFVIIFTVFAIGAQCRSVTLSNVRDAGKQIPVNTPEHLLIEELIKSYEENFAKLVNFAMKMSKNTDTNKREVREYAIQFLNQLGLLIEQLIQKQSKVRGMYADLDNDTDSVLQVPSNSSTVMNSDDVKDLINTMKEIDIIYQDGEITDEHIRIKRAAEGYKRTVLFATSEERMTNMLIDIQRQVVQIRKYLDKLCKKHHSTSATILEVNPDDDVSSVTHPNKVPIT